jgi:hypothetical protein
MVDKTDPICGMQGTIPAHGKWFCSQHCVNVYAKQQGLDVVKAENSSKLPAVLLVSFLILGMVGSLLYAPIMLPFMAVVLAGLAVLKFLDLQGFADAFSMYDIIAKRSRGYALAYPFIEIALAAAFALRFQLTLAAGVLAALMIIGLLGVAGAVKSGKKLRCACMGTKINVPLTTLTTVENSVMLIMALWMLSGHV